MASAAKQATRSVVAPADLQSFTEHLKKCRRVVALVGAGLSAASGLPTFRGAGGLWRRHDATDLATPEAFEANPDLVWQFYSFRRHMALKAAPNKAHFALAELARRNKDFITLSQNVDGLSQRAEHPTEQLHLLHGSLFNIKCTSFYCNYTRNDDFTDPIVPALAIPKKSSLGKSDSEKKQEKQEKTNEEIVRKGMKEPIETDVEAAAQKDEAEDKSGKTEVTTKDKSKKEEEKQEAESDEEIDISDISNHIPNLSAEELPQCPECKGLLRPGVVWFGESLPTATLKYVDNWIESGPIDLILVIGTSSQVYPAAGYVDEAREKGARVAVINMEPYSPVTLSKSDWFFQGDASVIIPEILESVIGKI
ncbi:uncharacterized protein N7469_010279 [Penicillium citrinum]|uniref:Deacetylase sirtuin-type domain-containing protein n=1 Tax=Penicillium citrinum TaxID=5077 RepID=A0A9W9NK49_PENCI|nr:uncharacterized protein N7469_010279 [Penicillium citrinum]KAJ5221392.1 hypothetical protein N7469_010279 [Penicillium citrinum]